MTIPGLDLDQLHGFLSSTVPELASTTMTAELIAGGRSNLTYRLHNGTAEYILRRQPLGHVLPSAHDMKREFRVLSALRDSPIPVPGTIVLCADPGVIGSPFYLMENVRGTIFRSSDQLSELGAESVQKIAFSLIDCLADLHAVDPAEVGLADFGRVAGYNERQLRRWSAQLDSSQNRELIGMPEFRSALAAGIPNPPVGSIVHGDFRLDNVVFNRIDSSAPSIAAVLDWEMSTLGDPLADLALTLLYTGRPIPSGGTTDLQPPPIKVPGHPSLDQLIQRYARRSGRDITELRWYRAFAAFKLAVILEGIHYRYQQGQTIGDGFATIGDLVPGLIEEGLTTIQNCD